MAKFIHVSHASLTKRELRAVSRVLRSGWLTLGKETLQFEQELAAYLNAKHVTYVNSCTSALHLSLIAAGIGKGDEVITTPLTFAATGNAILHTGATPVFVDIDPATGNIDPNKIAPAITRKTKALLPVHYAGLPCDMQAITSLSRKHRLTVIEDAAHAFGAAYRGKKIGTFSHYTCFSFYAAKNLVTIEGGAIAYPKKSNLALFEKLRLHGLSRNAWKRYAASGNASYTIDLLGYKYNPNDVGAALGRVQLSRFAHLQQKREKIARFYRHHLQTMPELILPTIPPDITHAWHIFVVRCRRSKDRGPLILHLREKSIGTSIHFPALHLQPLYRHLGYQKGDLPHAEAFARSCLTLPLHPAMTPKDAQRVVKEIKTFFG